MGDLLDAHGLIALYRAKVRPSPSPSGHTRQCRRPLSGFVGPQSACSGCIPHPYDI
jgi:hypothetical protein